MIGYRTKFDFFMSRNDLRFVSSMTVNFVISCDDRQYYVNKLTNAETETWTTIKIGKINDNLMHVIADYNPNKINIESPTKEILECINDLSCDAIYIIDPKILVPISRANKLVLYIFSKYDFIEEYLLQFTLGNISKLIIYICNINKKLLNDIKHILEHYYDISGAKKNAYDDLSEYFSKYSKRETLNSTFGIEITNENLIIGFSNDYIIVNL